LYRALQPHERLERMWDSSSHVCLPMLWLEQVLMIPSWLSQQRAHMLVPSCSQVSDEPGGGGGSDGDVDPEQRAIEERRRRLAEIKAKYDQQRASAGEGGPGALQVWSTGVKVNECSYGGGMHACSKRGGMVSSLVLRSTAQCPGMALWPCTCTNTRARESACMGSVHASACSYHARMCQAILMAVMPCLALCMMPCRCHHPPHPCCPEAP
jgi:hypothetical protein